MTAWTLLTAHSSLTTGTAWNHLNNQTGGGSGVIINTGATSVVTDSRYVLSVKDNTYGIPISNNISVSVPVQNIVAAFPSSGISVIVSTKQITI